jgi:hypothetical protein
MRKVFAGGFTGLAAIIAAWLALSGGGVDVSACPAPRFPDATCTGVPSGTILTAYTGPNPVTADNTIIDAKTINETLDIRASNVVIKNSDITAGVIFGDDLGYGKLPLQLLDDNIECSPSPPVWDTGISGANMIIRRIHLKGCTNGLSVDQNVDMRDSYVEYVMSNALEAAEPDAHDDVIQVGCGHWDPSYSGPSCAPGFAPGAKDLTFIHNTLLGHNEDGTLTTSVWLFNPPSPPSIGPGDGKGINTNILIQGNLIAGGTYSIYCSTSPDVDFFTPDRATDTNFRIVNNRFSTRFRPTVGYFGPSNGGCANETQVTGNVYDETGLPITLP